MKKNKQQNTFEPDFEGQGIIDFAPTRKRCRQGKTVRKRTLFGICLALIAATGLIATTITVSITNATAQPAFTTANAIAAKQDAGVGTIAAIAVMIIAAGALATFSNRKSA